MDNTVVVIRNGMDITWDIEESKVDTFIEEQLKAHQNLFPIKICDKEVVMDGHIVRLIVYRYKTLYREVFMVQKGLGL